MRARRLLLPILTTVPLALAPPPAAAQGWVGESSMLGGTARYDRGEWIWQDFVYDDYGANTEPAGASQRVSLAPTAGDFRYPTDDARYGGNAADVVELRLRLEEGGSLRVRVTLNTMLDPGAAVVGVGVARPGTPPRPWPAGAGVSSPWEVFATVAEGLVRLEGPGALQPAPAQVDAEANTVEFSMPLPGEGPLRVVAGAGLWDAARHEWLAGQPGNSPTPTAYSTGAPTASRVFDLAFNSNELEPEGGNWREDAQARALAEGDVSAFAATVDPDRLRSGASDPPITAPGFYDRIFRSRQDLGEGVAGGFPQYRGRWQPYGLWIPQGYHPASPAPLVLVLHSLSVHHNQYAGSNVYRHLGDGLGALAVTPLARGPDGWYWNEALVDTLEAWADVRAHYAVDDQRTYATGYSMGGYGTWRLATLMPDRFAGAVSWVGPPAYQLWAYPLEPVPAGTRRGPGNTWFQLENLEHVPVLVVHGTNDELVPVTGVLRQADRLRELGYEHRLYLHPGLDHFAFAVLDDWTRERAWLAGRARAAAPGHVRFRLHPAAWADGAGRAVVLEHLEALGADLDSAYWVRDVRLCEGAEQGVVDATSEAVAGRVPQPAEVVGAALGPPSPYLVRGVSRALGAAPVADRLVVQTEGVAELTVDLGGAGLSPGAQVTGTARGCDLAVRLRAGGAVVRTVLLPAE